MYKKTFEVDTKTLENGLIEPDIQLEKGMTLHVMSYSPDKKTCKCLAVRSDVNDFTKLTGKNMKTLTVPFDSIKNIVRVHDKDGKVTDSLDTSEIGKTKEEIGV